MPIFNDIWNTEKKGFGVAGRALQSVGQDIFGKKKKPQQAQDVQAPVAGEPGPMLVVPQPQAPATSPQAANDFLTTDAGPVGQARVPMHGYPRGTEMPPEPGFGRTWHRNATGTTSPVQTFKGKIGAPNVIPQVGGGRDFSGGGGGMGAEAAQQIGSFYDKLGIPLGGVMQGAQRDEVMGRQAFTNRETGEGVTRGLQQQAMAHELARAPQNEALKALEMMGQTGMYEFGQTPEGKALIHHYASQLMPPGAPVAETPKKVETPVAPPPVSGGGWRAALRTGIPAAAGTAGWGLGSALAPETGGLSWLIPGAASVASAFGGNKLMDYLDPQGMQAVGEHPVAALAGTAAGAYGGYKGVGRMGAKTQAPAAAPEAPPVINRPVQTSAGVGAGEGSAPWEMGGPSGSEATPTSANPQALSALEQFRTQLGIQPVNQAGQQIVATPPLPPLNEVNVLNWLRQQEADQAGPAAVMGPKPKPVPKPKKPTLATGTPPF